MVLVSVNGELGDAYFALAVPGWTLGRHMAGLVSAENAKPVPIAGNKKSHMPCGGIVDASKNAQIARPWISNPLAIVQVAL